MANGNSLIEAHDYMEQTGCDLTEALEALNWQETEIRRKNERLQKTSGSTDSVVACGTEKVRQ